MAWYIAKIKKVDLRSGGSGNLGASNATIMMGKRAGLLTVLHDVSKVILAAMVCHWVFPSIEYAPAIAAASGVVGHIYPFYLKFHGGKGFASYIGLGLVIDWRFGLIMIIGLLLVSIIADWIVAGTFFHILVTPIYVGVTQHWLLALFVLSVSICIFVKHIENIKRKRLSQEFSLRSVVFKRNVKK